MLMIVDAKIFVSVQRNSYFAGNLILYSPYIYIYIYIYIYHHLFISNKNLLTMKEILIVKITIQMMLENHKYC